jgi:glycosyltransferase involved in cell wall biosynthesis
MAELPSISIVIPTFNAEAFLPGCLASIKEQKYPEEKLEIIVVDGGSRDRTVDIAKSYDAKIFYENIGRPEAATAIGYNKAKNELIANIPSDNVLPHKEWLTTMVEPFLKCKNVVAVQTLRYTYDKTFSLMDRYLALFGAEPLAYYLNKRDRISWREDNWTLTPSVKDMGTFFLVSFQPHNIPTVGANGYLVKRKVIQKVTKNPLNFFHIDSNVDIIQLGHNNFGIVKADIIHRSGEKFFKYFKKRIRYALIYFIDKRRRRYHLFDDKTDTYNLVKFIVFSLTLIKPVIDAIKGYRKIPDLAWFLHPIVCYVLLISYSFVVFKRLFDKNGLE